MKDSKNLVIGMLCAVVCIMAVAYAAFQTSLNVNGTTTIASEWDVAIESINCGESTLAQTSNDGTTATFTANFTNPGDEVTCTVTIKNGGTLPAVVAATDGVIITGDNENTTDNLQIKVDMTGENAPAAGKALAVGGTHVYTINAKYVGKLNPDSDSDDFVEEEDRTKSVTVKVNYEQDFS